MDLVREMINMTYKLVFILWPVTCISLCTLVLVNQIRPNANCRDSSLSTLIKMKYIGLKCPNVGS